MHRESCSDDHMPVTRGYMQALSLGRFVAPENFRKFDFFRNPSVASRMGLGDHLVTKWEYSSAHWIPRNDPHGPGDGRLVTVPLGFEPTVAVLFAGCMLPFSLGGALPKAIKFSKGENCVKICDMTTPPPPL